MVNNIINISIITIIVIADYPNGAVIRRVTACKYKQFEVEAEDPPGLWETYCPRSDMLCPRPEPQHRPPSALTRRGLQVTPQLYSMVGDSAISLVLNDISNGK